MTLFYCTRGNVARKGQHSQLSEVAPRPRQLFQKTLLVSALTGITMMGGSLAFAQEEVSPKAPPALSTVQVPQVNNLNKFVKKTKDAILLGKAFFWDRQAGSDGQACASCHFHAGVDNRVKNQLTPGLNRVHGNDNPNPDTTFQPTASGGNGGPNYTLVPEDFPFHQFNDPNDRNSGVKFSTNDIASSQGTFGGNFQAVPNENDLNDVCERFPDPVFHVNNIGVRKVEPRHTPGVINAVFNFRNFWDGRANNVFNGVDPFGLRNTQARVFRKNGSTEKVDLRNSSLASQAVGPPESDFEMICTGRKFAQMGQKLIPRRALKFQQVHPNDSVLGSKVHGSGIGLKDTYKKLIEKAFKKQYWDGKGSFGGGFTQMEANFSLFWGIAVQLYQSTLISDQAPYDAFAAGHSSEFEPEEGDKSKLTDGQFRGLKIFLDKGKCINCHKGPEFSGAASVLQAENQENGLVERMIMGDGGVALYDNGFYNIGVTPTNEDISVGGNDPFGNPLSWTKQFVNGNFVDPFQVDPCTFEVPFSISNNDDDDDDDDNGNNCSNIPNNLNNERQAVRGAFKTAILRNVELTGPFMHNGSMKTLKEVVEFYNRGGNFHNNPELDPDIRNLGLNEFERADLVAFMLSLTDPRVANESAPFDHPQIQVPNGHPGNENNINAAGELHPNLANDDFLVIPAVGKDGRSAESLPPLQPFFNIVEDDDPPADPNAENGNVRDEFSANAYDNNDGTVNWAGNWIENDANGQGATGGQAEIKRGELSLEDQPDTGTQPSLAREVNLSGQGSATFTFDFRTISGVDSSDSVVVEASNNGGGSWTVLETFTGISGAIAESRSFDISSFISSNTQIRFRVNANYGGSNEDFLVDNVDIAFGGSGGGGPVTQSIDVRVSGSSNDAEEASDGRMYRDSTDLELVFDSFDNQGNQTVGMRFGGVTIPQGATIVNAFIQFQADESDSGGTSLTIRGHNTNNAGGFTSSNGNISSRSMTSASVGWSPAAWSTGQAGAAQQTPNLAAVVQEIVNRGGWSSGNSMVLIVTGSGQRVAESVDGNSSAAPLLHVEFQQ